MLTKLREDFLFNCELHIKTTFWRMLVLLLKHIYKFPATNLKNTIILAFFYKSGNTHQPTKIKTNDDRKSLGEKRKKITFKKCLRLPKLIHYAWTGSNTTKVVKMSKKIGWTNWWKIFGHQSSFGFKIWWSNSTRMSIYPTNVNLFTFKLQS